MYKIKKTATFNKEETNYIEARDKSIPLKFVDSVDDFWDSRMIYQAVIKGKKVELYLDAWEVEAIAGK